MSRARVLALVLGAAGLVATVGYAGALPVEQAVWRVGVAGLLLVALIHLPVIMTTGSAWFLIGRELRGASPWKFIWARYVREATAEVLPFSQLGGIVAGVRSLSMTGLDSLAVSGALLSDLIIEQLAKVPYVLAGAALLLLGTHAAAPRVIGAALLPVCLLAVLVLGARARLVPLLERAVQALARRRRAVGGDQMADLRPILQRLIAWDRRTAGAFATHTAAWALGAVETWVVCHLMGLGVTAAQALIVDSLFCGLRTFGFAIPAALGAQEAGYVLVCALVAVPAAPAVTLSLVRRVRELLVGMPALGAWQLLEGGRALAGLSGK